VRPEVFDTVPLRRLDQDFPRILGAALLQEPAGGLGKQEASEGCDQEREGGQDYGREEGRDMERDMRAGRRRRDGRNE
jgi:hypothetical protein